MYTHTCITCIYGCVDVITYVLVYKSVYIAIGNKTNEKRKKKILKTISELMPKNVRKQIKHGNTNEISIYGHKYESIYTRCYEYENDATIFRLGISLAATYHNRSVQTNNNDTNMLHESMHIHIFL